MCIGANGHECASVANLTQLKYLQLFHTDPLPVLNSLCDRRDALEDLVISTFKVSVCLTLYARDNYVGGIITRSDI